MKNIETALIVDYRGGQNIFEVYAQEIEQASLVGKSYDANLEIIQNKMENIERLLQDLSENINVSNENKENVYSLTIDKSRELLGTWIGLFRERNKFPNITDKLVLELIKLEDYVALNNVRTKTIEEIKKDFETRFILDTTSVNSSSVYLDYVEAVQNNDLNRINSLSKEILKTLYSFINAQNLVREKNLINKTEIKNIPIAFDSNQSLDIENYTYTWDFTLYINTTNAVEANKFMNLVSSVLGYIEEVEIEIIESSVGSLKQRWKVKFKNWFSKDDAKQILEKGTKAVESYVLDKHIEPIEKSKIERQKTEEEIKRLMSEEQAKELHELNLEERRIQVRIKKLESLKLEIELKKSLTEMLKNGLLEVDTDFCIMINDLLLVKKENNIIEIGDIEDIDSNGQKERIEQAG